MTEVLDKLKSAFQLMKQLQLELHAVLSTVQPTVGRMALGEAVDSGFLCRELSNIMEDLRKNLDARKELIGRVLAMRTAQQALQGEELKLEGELATASPSITVKPKLPEKHTHDWVQLMRFLGCTDKQIHEDMLRPSWKEIQGKIEAAMAEGKECTLPGVDPKWVDQTVIFRTKTRNKKD